MYSFCYYDVPNFQKMFYYFLSIFGTFVPNLHFFKSQNGMFYFNDQYDQYIKNEP